MADDREREDELRRRVARLETFTLISLLSSRSLDDKKAKDFVRFSLREAEPFGLLDFDTLIDFLSHTDFSSEIRELRDQIERNSSRIEKEMDRLRSAQDDLKRDLINSQNVTAQIASDQSTLSAGTHQWLAAQSLGLGFVRQGCAVR